MGGHAEHQLVFKERVGVNSGESKVQMIKCYLGSYCCQARVKMPVSCDI